MTDERPRVLRSAEFASLEELRAAVGDDPALFVVPIADLPAVLAGLRRGDDLVLEGADEALIRHRLERMVALADVDRDALTGLWNRMHFLRCLAAWPPATVEGQRPVRSVILLDLDRFKEVNDTWGHPVGDEVLQELGRRMLVTAPPDAVCARIGGEVLAVLLHVGREAAMDLARRLHAATRDRPYAQQIRVTASVAVATAGTDTSAQGLLRMCDEAMYAAKAQGRDRVLHHADVRRQALEADVDPQIQGFENLTRVIADRVADLLARRGRRLFEQVQAQADVDALTGLYSRRYLDRRWAFELGEGRPEGPITAALLDIDHFGQVNKSHGWPTGDAVLAGVAGRVRDEVRTTDWAARYGGEELLVVLHETELEAGLLVLERIRARVAAAPFAGPTGVQVPVTLSAGVAQLADAEDAEAFKQRLADRLLEAKNEGRNRVVG